MVSTKYITGCMVAVSLLLSCSKKESFDVKGDPEVKFFVNNTALGNAPQNSISYAVVNNPAAGGWVNLSSSVPATISIPVYATREVSQNVAVNASLDNSLIAAYNTANNTNYVAFPDGFLNASNLQAGFSKGAMVSGDSLIITTDQTKTDLLTSTAYMAPVKLTSVSAAGIGQVTANAAQSIIYVIANVELRRIRFLATEASHLLGSRITDRSSWAVTVNPDPINTGSVTDGSTSSFLRWGVSAAQVDLNMQESKNVTGIRIHTSTSSTTSPTQVDVRLSQDGVNYDLIGTPLRANLTYSSGYTYILFYQPIPARFLRLNLSYSTSTNTQNRRLTELDVYAN